MNNNPRTVACLIGWTVMKALVPRYKPVTP
jgi:hypothetical protein